MIDKELTLTLDNNYLEVGNYISSYKTSGRITRILNYLGCSSKYNYIVIDGPNQYEDISTGSVTHYEYKVKLLSKMIRVFSINIYKIEL